MTSPIYLCHSVVRYKKTKSTDRAGQVTISILPEKSGFWNSQSKKKYLIPYAFSDGASCIYLLINDICPELERFIQTGNNEDICDFNVLSKMRWSMLLSKLEQQGFAVTYHSQKISYNYKTVTITYPKAHNAESGMSIYLIPWFLLPKRSYPVFVYVYAIWHYHNQKGKKSLKKSAAAAAKLFGIRKFNKSTLSRNIKAMENFIAASKISRPLSVDNWKGQCGDAEIWRAVEILSSFKSIEEVKEKYGDIANPLPSPVGITVQQALSRIPDGLSKIIKDNESCRGKSSDARKRAKRPRKRNMQCVQRPYSFVDSAAIKRIRAEFIEKCRCIVLDAAASYHQIIL